MTVAPETLEVPVVAETVKLRRLLINGYLLHAYLNIVSIPEQPVSISSLRRNRERACL